MWNKITSILLVVLLVQYTSGVEKWRRSAGVANVACPLDDDPDDPTVLPFPGDCTKFIKCSYGLGYPLSCPTGLHWDKTLDRCESPYVAKCDPTAITPKPEAGGNGCTYKYKPHADCKKAYQCVNGVVSVLECPNYAFWDKSKNKCVVDQSVC